FSRPLPAQAARPQAARHCVRLVCQRQEPVRGGGVAVGVEAFVSVRQPQWDRLAYPPRRQRRLSGAEAEELVTLYQRVGTHLSALRAAGADPVSIGRLSGLIADARGAVTGA